MINPVKLLGELITSIGMAAIILMFLVGTIAIDIVILAYLSKEARRNDNHDHQFLTGYLFGLFWSNHDSNHRSFYSNTKDMMIASMLLTAVAILLSVVLEVPEVGALLVSGWAVSCAIILLGMAVYSLGDILGAATVSISAWFKNVSHETRQNSNPTVGYSQSNHPAPPHSSPGKTGAAPTRQPVAITPSAPPAPASHYEKEPPPSSPLKSANFYKPVPTPTRITPSAPPAPASHYEEAPPPYAP